MLFRSKKYKDTSSIEEGHAETCNECGMMESECECDHEEQVEESYANSDDDKAMQDLQYMLQTLAGGLNKPKTSQATGNIIKVTMEDTLMISPVPCSVMASTTACMQLKGPLRSTVITLSHCSSVIFDTRAS